MIFQYALDQTTGQDLYKVLWLKSKNSEAWLDRRTNYTRSLAVMSMVGYILGLGDRHPSNLMLDQFSGEVIHIDFGDCFEVAMNREKFPERIPFRLTRMLVNAMEVSGIEGSFRSTCNTTMSVLRQNKESLMAVLEAFVHDPLINWRLLGNHSPAEGSLNFNLDAQKPMIDEYFDSKQKGPAGRKLAKDENEEDEINDLGDGLYQRSGEPVVLCDANHTAGMRGDSPFFVAHHSGFALLQSYEPSCHFVFEKASRQYQTSQSRSSSLICDGDTVIIKIIRNSDIRYLSTHHGWWLKFV